jgi:hypothetical protein
MARYAKIVDHKHLVRDLHSKAILNTDPTVLRKHEKRIIDLQKEEERKNEINIIKSDIAEIKNLLKSLTRQ